MPVYRGLRVRARERRLDGAGVGATETEHGRGGVGQEAPEGTFGLGRVYRE